MSAVTVQRGLYFEEFSVGARFTTASHPVTAEEIARFAELTGDDNPLHVDREAAASAGFSDVIAHGFLVQSLAMGLIADLGIMRGTTVALVGATLRFVAPTVAGDDIHVELRVTKKRLLAAKPMGLLYRHATVVNQHGTVVVQGRLVNLMHCWPEGRPS
jgi:acyl dehydratase